MGVTMLARWAAAPNRVSYVRSRSLGEVFSASGARQRSMTDCCPTTSDDGLLPDYLEEFIDLLADTKLNSHLACAERNPHHGRTTFRENENALQADRS